MIQPLDIKTQKFKKGLFGYKPMDVDSFVDSVYRAYDELYQKNTELSSNLEKLNASLQESRLKMFDLENKVQKMENVSSYDEDDTADAKKKADEIIKNAEEAAAQIIAKAKAQGEKLEHATAPKTETVKEEPKEAPKESASSKFFKKEENTATVSSSDDDDDEIFVGEIEDARKPDRMMIGDGEEEEEADFEFL